MLLTATDFGSEVESQTIWSNERTLLICLPQNSAEGKVQGVRTRVVFHDKAATILLKNANT